MEVAIVGSLGGVTVQSYPPTPNTQGQKAFLRATSPTMTASAAVSRPTPHRSEEPQWEETPAFPTV